MFRNLQIKVFRKKICVMRDSSCIIVYRVVAEIRFDNMDTLTKILLVIMLLGGAGLGYGLEYVLTNPVIEGLETDLNDTKVELDITNSELRDLKINYSVVESNFSRYEDYESSLTLLE